MRPTFPLCLVTSPCLLALATALLPAADPTWTEVHAILDARCIECHGPAKQKGHLRLDTPEWLQQGSKEGAVVVAGKPTESKLYTLAALPADHDDRMPPKGERLTEAQLATVKAWITAGASYAVVAPAAPAAPGAAPMAMPAGPEVAAIPAAPVIAAAVLDSLQKQQISTTKLAGGWLEVNAAHTKNGITTDQLELLAKAAPAIAYLDLANAGLTDKQSGLLSGCTKVRRLHLEGNPLSDAAMPALAKLSELEYLNLVSTKVSDSGLGHLKALSHLDQLYLWQSAVTAAGVADLQKTLTQTTIVLSPDDLPTDKMAPGKGKKKKK